MLATEMAPELTKFTRDLRAVRKWQVRICSCQHVEAVNLIVERDLTLYVEPLDEVVYGL